MKWYVPVALLLLGACAPVPPIALGGTPADLEQLVGEWEGEYTGGPHGRSGSIVFTLAAGEDHAHGDVLMVPQGAERGYSPYPGRPTSDELPQVLTIRFVNSHDGRVTGSLERYWDPDARCAASAAFRGIVSGYVMEGTFTSACDDGRVPALGRWKVRRR
jgi:hypothetical protein